MVQRGTGRYRAVRNGAEQSNGRGWVQVVQGHSNKATPKLGSRDLVNHILTSTGLADCMRVVMWEGAAVEPSVGMGSD